MKLAIGPVFQAFKLDGSSQVPLYRQLYHLLREALITGAILPGERLPSSRTLAEDLDLSRNTVTAAFDRLLDEGFIESRVGDGSYASAALADEGYRDATGGLATAERKLPDWAAVRWPERSDAIDSARAHRRDLSFRGSAIARSVLGRDTDHPRAFSVGIPALDAFPLTAWRRILARRARGLEPPDLQHGPVAGDLRLRELVARHLNISRGVACSPEQLLILPSAQFGLDLIGRLLLDPGDRVWVEDPGYLGARGALLTAGAQLIPVPVDDQGLRVGEGREMAPEARLAYVTPSHQFPLGESMSLRRRLQLLAWAEEAGAWIVEDDYDSEYRYAGPATQALQGLDRSGRVFYLGTFSKVLFPGMRLGYMVIPEDLFDAFTTARFLTDGHVSASAQAALADFIEAGHLVGHLRKMRRLYRERRDVLIEELTRRFDGLLRISGADAGMHVSVRLALRLAQGDDHALVRTAAEHGLDLAPLSRYYLGPKPIQGLTLGYSHVPPEEIVRAAGLLEELLQPG